MRNYQTPPRQNQANPGTAPNGAKNGRFPADVPPRNEARPATKTGGGRPAPPPPPPRRKFAQERAEASFGSRKNGSYPRTDVRDEPPAESSNYRSPHTSSPNASNPNPDTSAQAPPPVPQRPSPTAKTDPPDIVNPHTMDKDNTPPTTSTPPHQPPEFPFPQPAQTTPSPKRSQQPAESKQSTGTIPMPPAPQDTNDEPAWTEWQSDTTPNANEKRPGNPETPFNLDKAGSGGVREFPKVSALSFPTPPIAPQIPASIDGAQPSVSDSESYLKDFKNYLNEWNLFKNRIIGHFSARKKAMNSLKNPGSDDIQEYYEWLVLDDDLRGLFIAAGEEHKRQFREFMMLFQM
ncbi:hypothetical protein Forpe1208_v012440 [Fusarium oxysporum f. sp. rapae]|uniref:Uncharacterized protein n=1 Tax=Fusarium oxysporum f. sp. rapae TaxID=485398 RepID=A0A8J5NPJ7_FUSOX|nr:hypothetical protein Forpe1208_v012440 [Fusarium oxysporum f. sp. rapae]